MRNLLLSVVPCPGNKGCDDVPGMPIGDWIAPLLLITAIVLAVYYIRKHAID